MARKIVRDINKQGQKIISLNGPVENTRKPVVYGRNVLNLSGAASKKMVVTNAEATSIKDLGQKPAPPGSTPKPRGEVIFLRVEDDTRGHSDRLGEMIRMIAFAILILFSINIINVYQKGIVIKNNLVASAFSGYESLLQAGSNVGKLDMGSAENKFSQAEQNFNSAINDLYFLQSNTDIFFTKEKTVDSINNLLEAASKISSAGGDFMNGLSDLKKLPGLFIQANSRFLNLGQKQVFGGRSLTEQLKGDLEFMEKAGDKIISASNNLAAVSEDILPPDFKGKFIALKQKVQKISELISSLRLQIPAILDLLGDRYPHRYLILLQNDAESRPTGGFIGSFLIVDVNDGYITKMEFHDVYDMDGQLQENITPPPDIAKVSKNWRLRDSNYSPDFPLSAQKAIWFLQKEKGPGVDSVIAVNQNLIANLFDITGPVQLASLKAPLDKDNYQLILSYIIESKLTGLDSPKQILNEFIPAFLKKLFSGNSIEKSLGRITRALQEKDILAYSTHDAVESLFEQSGVAGRIVDTHQGEDYLNVVNTSIGGNKSDLFLQQEVQHNTLILQDGSIVDEVEIKKSHTWSEQSLNKLRQIVSDFGFTDLPDQIVDILGRGVNKTFVKVYVPPQSELLSAEGISQDQIETHLDTEINKGYFMFQIEVPAGSDKTVKLSYKLPYKLNLASLDSYKFFTQNQPAINKIKFTKTIILKPGLQSYGQYPPAELVKDETGSMRYAGLLNKTIFLSSLVGE